MKSDRYLVLFAVLSVLAFGLVIGALAYITVDRADRGAQVAQEVQNGLIQTCKSVGDPMLRVAIDQLEKELQQARTFNYEKFFPNIPPRKLKTLVARQNARNRKYLHVLKSAPPCGKRY